MTILSGGDCEKIFLNFAAVGGLWCLLVGVCKTENHRKCAPAGRELLGYT